MRQPFFRGAFAASFLCVSLLLPIAAVAQDRQPVTVEQVEKAVAQIEHLAQREIELNAVPGLAIGVVFQDKLVYAKGFGVRDTTTGEPVDANTVFQLASLSKPVSSTLVAALIGEGKISWDSRVSDLDPTFEMYVPWVTRELALRDLYAHRSGLPDHAGDILEDVGYTREEILHRLRYQRPDTSFRSSYAYTNFGITEGAIAAAKAYGLTWEDAVEEKLFKPLGMTSTSARHADFMARPNKALGHVLVDGKWVQKFTRDPDAQSPAGGVSSNVGDMAKWMRLQLADGKYEGKQIVAERPLAETHLPQIMTSATSLSGIPQFYGLGWNVGYSADGRLKLSHSGAFELGAGTNVNMSPSDQLGVIVLTNGAPTGVAEGLAAEFLDIAIYGTSTQPWLEFYKGLFVKMEEAERGTDYSTLPSQPQPAAANGAYLGTYTNDFFGDVSIIEKNGRLAIVQGPRAKTFPMEHYDRDVFTYLPEGEMATGQAAITFTIGTDGKATQVLVENLNANGEGLFARKVVGAVP